MYTPLVVMPVVVGAAPLSYQSQRRSMLFASAASAAVNAITAGYVANGQVGVLGDLPSSGAVCNPYATSRYDARH